MSKVEIPVTTAGRPNRTVQDILKEAKDKKVKLIRLQFVDMHGMPKSMSIHVHQLEKVLNNEIMLDGSSIAGFRTIETSDMYFYPDLSTFTVMPWLEDGCAALVAVLLAVVAEESVCGAAGVSVFGPANGFGIRAVNASNAGERPSAATCVCDDAIFSRASKNSVCHFARSSSLRASDSRSPSTSSSNASAS